MGKIDWEEAKAAVRRFRTESNMGVQQQNEDGTWGPSEPLPMYNGKYYIKKYWSVIWRLSVCLLSIYLLLSRNV